MEAVARVSNIRLGGWMVTHMETGTPVSIRSHHFHPLRYPTFKYQVRNLGQAHASNPNGNN
eukprot:scaffold28291_cov36-Attheya_sp.AAC.2